MEWLYFLNNFCSLLFCINSIALEITLISIIFKFFFKYLMISSFLRLLCILLILYKISIISFLKTIKTFYILSLILGFSAFDFSYIVFLRQKRIFANEKLTIAVVLIWLIWTKIFFKKVFANYLFSYNCTSIIILLF
jgi:hypothetical protein